MEEEWVYAIVVLSSPKDILGYYNDIHIAEKWLIYYNGHDKPNFGIIKRKICNYEPDKEVK